MGKSVKENINACRKLAETWGVTWTREKMIEHWKSLLNKDFPYPIVHHTARLALINLSADREPGEDDE